MKFVVAIDGTSSSGKSTTAKLVAKRLGFTHMDTGAMYRAVTYLFLQKDALQASDKLLETILLATSLEFKIQNRSLAVWLARRLLNSELRTPEVDRFVSPVSERAIVRAFLVAKQREIGSNRKLVCEGRDIGSVVFPDAELKVFMTCDLDERTRRRQKELQEKGIQKEFEEVKANLAQRDEMDSNRKISPLVCTPDAFCVDTTKLTIDEQVAIVEKEVRKRMGGGKVKSSWVWTWVITYPIFRWIFGIRIHGRNKIPKKGAVLIAANHRSFADPPLMGHAAKRECFFLAKEELFDQSRFFRWLIAYYNALPIRRGKAFDISLFKMIDRLIKMKQAIIVFPEGTRSRTGKFLPFKEGVGLIALRYNIPVVPAYIKNTSRPWTEWLTRRSRVEVFFGNPIYPEGPSKDKAKYEAFTQRVEREVHRLAEVANAPKIRLIKQTKPFPERKAAYLARQRS